MQCPTFKPCITINTMRNSKFSVSVGFLFGIVFFMLLPRQTFADSTSLVVSPAVFSIQAKPPADIWTPFVIENHSDKPVSLTIGYKPFDPQSSSNGSVIFLTNGQQIPRQDKNIFEKMQIVDDQNISHDTIALGPKQKERLRLHIVLPQNEPTGDYYFSMIFLENTDQADQNNTNTNTEDQKSSSVIQGGIAINVLLAVGDKETPIASIENFTAPWFNEQGPVAFTLSLHNSGLHFITPQGVILIKNMFGQTVGKVTVPASIVLAGTSRTFTSTKIPMSANSSLPTSLIWPEYFLLGQYSATLTLTLSDKGPVFIRSIHFFAIPFTLLVEILAVLVIITYIFLRVKKKI